VVASPKPQSIVEKSAIAMLVNNGFSVIAVGGGGIPVIEVDNQLIGVNAVIDKDYASAMLAAELKADYFIISTAVDQVYINYNQPGEMPVAHLNLEKINALR
jgi:carbamate kinase